MQYSIVLLNLVLYQLKLIINEYNLISPSITYTGATQCW